ncbi:hypothetical protein J3R82DRAFT_10544 [Butyriboletus roseoflavus]|nr:hypothetical protein J3R82DRAFT_10544 [Butyriboletus roseoflavus]
MDLFKIYPNHPTFEPCSDMDSIDTPTLVQQAISSSGLKNIMPPSDITCKNLFSVFSSLTAGLLIYWHFSGLTAKTKKETNHL